MKSTQDHNINDKLNFSEELSKEFLREMKLKRRWGFSLKRRFYPAGNNYCGAVYRF